MTNLCRWGLVAVLAAAWAGAARGAEPAGPMPVYDVRTYGAKGDGKALDTGSFFILHSTFAPSPILHTPRPLRANANAREK